MARILLSRKRVLPTPNEIGNDLLLVWHSGWVLHDQAAIYL